MTNFSSDRRVTESDRSRFVRSVDSFDSRKNCSTRRERSVRFRISRSSNSLCQTWKRRFLADRRGNEFSSVVWNLFPAIKSHLSFFQSRKVEFVEEIHCGNVKVEDFASWWTRRRRERWLRAKNKDWRKKSLQDNLKVKAVLSCSLNLSSIKKKHQCAFELHQSP